MFKTRLLKKEFIDDSNLKGEALRQNLKELKFINRYLGPQSCLLEAIEKVFQKKKLEEKNANISSRTIKIADLGCGAGDLLVAVHAWAKRKNIQVSLIGMDANPHILAFAEENSKHTPNLRYFKMDIHSKELLNYQFDIVYLSDVLHHFTEKEVINLLEKLKNISSTAIILCDLSRSRILYYFVILFTHLLNFSHLAKNDGPLSVLRSFRRPEILRLFKQAGLLNFEFKSSFIFRWQAIIWCGGKAEC